MSGKSMIIGIDNGVSGALAAISGKSIIAMLPMPVQISRKGREIDVLEVWRWMNDTIGSLRDNVLIVIEEPGGSKSSTAATSMAGSFHALRALCVIKHLRFCRVTPQQWQKVMLPGCKSGDTKARALTEARQIWPGESFLATERSRIPHDGLVDSALIAEYGRREYLPI